MRNTVKLNENKKSVNQPIVDVKSKNDEPGKSSPGRNKNIVKIKQ